jgi:hypothetical protein
MKCRNLAGYGNDPPGRVNGSGRQRSWISQANFIDQTHLVMRKSGMRQRVESSADRLHAVAPDHAFAVFCSQLIEGQPFQCHF